MLRTRSEHDGTDDHPPTPPPVTARRVAAESGRTP